MYIYSNEEQTSYQYFLIMLRQMHIVFNDISLNRASREASCNQPDVLSQTIGRGTHHSCVQLRPV